MKNFSRFYFSSIMIAFSLLVIASCDNPDEPEKDTIPEQSINFQIPSEDMAIDLGLSVKWAPYNVGASEPKDFGNYYAWGEVEPKKHYSVDNYTLDYFWAPDVSGTKNDVACVKWGLKWRIPTIDETLELVKKCQWQEVKFDDVIGMKVTGPSGNSIFLPAAGRCVGNRIEDRGSVGHYWQGTATASGEEPMYYYDLNQVTWGLSIRPVWAD